MGIAEKTPDPSGQFLSMLIEENISIFRVSVEMLKYIHLIETEIFNETLTFKLLSQEIKAEEQSKQENKLNILYYNIYSLTEKMKKKICFEFKRRYF